MKRHVIVSLIVCLVVLTSAVCGADFDDTVIDGLNITTDADAAFNASQSENKTLAIIFDQENCMYCDMLKDDVLSAGDVQEELNENYIVLLVDINKNPDLAAKYKAFGTPTVQFLDSNGNEVYRIEGYLPTQEFLKALKET